MFPLRPGVALLGAAMLLTAACSDDDGGSVAGPPPAGVPTAAAPAADVEFGDIAATPNDADDVRYYESLTCADGIMTIATSREMVYVLIPCDRSLPPDVAGRFDGVPIRLRVVTGNATKLYLESASQGTAEFTVDGVWIVPKT